MNLFTNFSVYLELSCILGYLMLSPSNLLYLRLLVQLLSPSNPFNLGYLQLSPGNLLYLRLSIALRNLLYLRLSVAFSK
jgi:hypothetical protein